MEHIAVAVMTLAVMTLSDKQSQGGAGAVEQGGVTNNKDLRQRLLMDLVHG